MVTPVLHRSRTPRQSRTIGAVNRTQRNTHEHPQFLPSQRTRARVSILASREIWTHAETVDLVDWLKQPIFEVDGLVYDLMTTIKIVADKEGAHIDPTQRASTRATAQIRLSHQPITKRT